MDIVVYPGCYDKQPDFFCEFLAECGGKVDIFEDYFGYCLTISIDTTKIKDVVEGICRFIVEYSLKEFVVNKIYDEYHMLDTTDAVDVLSKLCDELMASECGKEIENYLLSRGIFNVESYILFNIKKLMSTINSIVDKLCVTLVYCKKRSAIMRMIRAYSTLFEDACQSVDVEFCSETLCSVVIDKNQKINITPDELPSFLATKSPVNITVSNRNFCPQIADLIDEMFVSDKNGNDN